MLLMLANKDGRLGPKMKKAGNECDALGSISNGFARTAPTAPDERKGCGILPANGPGRIIANGIDMPTLAAYITQRMPVLDQTGLQGRYDVDVTYTRSGSRGRDRSH